MNINGQVGAIATTSSIATGQQPILRLGNMGDLIASPLQAKYYENTFRRSVFSTANSAAVATVALGTTTYTGLSLSNPIGSTVNLVILKGSYALSVAAPTAGYLGVETGYNSGTNVTHTAATTVANNFIGVGASGTGLGDSSSTLPTAPTNRLMLCNTSSIATTAYNGSAPQVFDFEGSIILPPGAYIAYYTFATNTAAWWFSWSWAEIPI